MIARLTVAAAAAALVAAAPPAAAPPADVVAPVDVRPVPASPLPVRVVPPPPVVPQPLICKSTLQTGSLIARRKQCLTKAQWRYVDDVQRQQNQTLFDDQRTKQGCSDAATC